MESKPMTTSEPTTGEIVRALREDCSLLDDNTDKFAAADRLESQAKENEISRHLIEMQSNVITELTARAESAERERDSAVAYMKRFGCLTCEGQGTIGANELCWGCRDKSNWKMRGLPQDGEGV